MTVKSICRRIGVSIAAASLAVAVGAGDASAATKISWVGPTPPGQGGQIYLTTSTINNAPLVDGVDTALAEGAATIAQELTAAASFDTIVAPVGDGSLISGLACGPAPMHLQHASSGSFRLGTGHAPLPRSSPAQTPTPTHSPPRPAAQT